MDLITINWQGRRFTSEQVLVLRNYAADYLINGKKLEAFDFAHELCVGVIKPGREGIFGTFAGTFFHADLGTVDGKPWTIDFLIPRGTEYEDPVDMRDLYGLQTYCAHPDHTVHEVDVDRAAIRHYANRSRARH